MFNGPLYRDMMRAYDASGPDLDQRALISWLLVEYKVFQLCRKKVLDECREVHAGQPFHQMSEDATHLKNHTRYIAQAYNLIWRGRVWNIATRFQRSQAKKAEEVAKVLKKTLEADGSSVDDMVGLMRDHAERAVARHLDKAKEGLEGQDVHAQADEPLRRIRLRHHARTTQKNAQCRCQ